MWSCKQRAGLGPLLVGLAALAWVSGCQSPSDPVSPKPKRGQPQLRLLDVTENAMVTGVGAAVRRVPQARIVLDNHDFSAIRVVAIEADIGRGQSVQDKTHWNGADTLPRGGQRVYTLPLRPQYVSAARSAIDSAQPLRLVRWRVAYDDANGLRHVASYP